MRTWAPRTWGLRAAEALWWWGATLGIWLLSLSAVSGQELLVASLSSLLCGPLAVYARLAAEHAWKLRGRWLLPALALPVAIVSDTVQVLASALTGGGGRFVRLGVEAGSGTGAAPDGRRAVATFLATLAPGSIVLDIDPDSGEALVHVVAERGPSMHELACR